MRLAKRFKSVLGNAFPGLAEPSVADTLAARMLMLQGSGLALQLRGLTQLDTLADVEFSVFSQWGEDGIIEWLVAQNGAMPETFVEFGVETYRESNTRFLAANRNWRGLIIDGSEEKIAIARRDQISWRHDIASVAAFITEDNINDLIGGAGINGEIGILSVDIDGNDYWVWKAIEVVEPHFVIVEFNGQFGDVLPLTIPYGADFLRTSAHFSNLYFGASIKAFEELGAARGYTLLGTNKTGINAFFVRNDRLPRFEGKIADRSPRPSRLKEARNEKGELTLVRGLDRVRTIAHLPVVNLATGVASPLREHGELFSNRWKKHIDGQV